MDLDVVIGKESLPVNIENHFSFDIGAVMSNIIDFGNKNEVDLIPFQLDELIKRMIKGVAGCEAGCPSDAKSIVRDGFGNFTLDYVEGGILTATQVLDNNKTLQVKIFPGF